MCPLSWTQSRNSARKSDAYFLVEGVGNQSQPKSCPFIIFGGRVNNCSLGFGGSERGIFARHSSRASRDRPGLPDQASWPGRARQQQRRLIPYEARAVAMNDAGRQLRDSKIPDEYPIRHLLYR
eukprot:scaffold103697_cov38-Prasinocladus_malaysianus.AAC.1